MLAATGGVLAFLGFVGFGIWPLALLCLAALWEALEEDAAGDSWKAARLGFTFGIAAYAGGFYWIWRLVDVFLGGNVLLGALLWAADASWFALRFALYAAGYALVRRRGGPLIAAALLPLLVTEWLYPALFPVYLGHALSGELVMQISALGGPLLLSALLVLLNLALFATWRWIAARAPRPDRAWAAAALGTALACTYGAVHLHHLENAVAAAPALRVGIVQGNLGVFEKGRNAALDHRKYLQQTRELLAQEKPDLVVWPETVYTRGLLRPLPLSARYVVGDLAVPILFGAASVRGDSGQRLKYNSALLAGADGVIRDVYDKNLLIPFTEYVPLAKWLEPLAPSLAKSSEFTAATDTPALSLGRWRISTPICYEAVRPAFVRRMLREARPQLIVTLANDSWFGDSQEPWLHLAMARARAVEHARYLVRSTNSGISAVVDPSGRLIARSGLLRRENLIATVHMLDEETLYTRWGDWPGWLSLAALIAVVGLGPRPSRPPSPTGPRAE